MFTEHEMKGEFVMLVTLTIALPLLLFGFGLYGLLVGCNLDVPGGCPLIEGVKANLTNKEFESNGVWLTFQLDRTCRQWLSYSDLQDININNLRVGHFYPVNKKTCTYMHVEYNNWITGVVLTSFGCFVTTTLILLYIGLQYDQVILNWIIRPLRNVFNRKRVELDNIV